MILYVMRHGTAEDRGPSGGDFDRALTDLGRGLVRAAAAELLRGRSDAPLPRVLASPLVRAQQTARIVVDVACLAGAGVDTRDELADETLPLDLVDELVSAGHDAMLVGHQPTVELLVRHLLLASTRGGARTDAPRLARGFSTASIVALACDPTSTRWSLGSLIDPREHVAP